MDSGKIPVKRLTRRQVSEAMQSVPMQSILMGANTGKDRKLTSKQIKFAEALAMGETKAGAYRKAYNSKAKPSTQSHTGSRMAKNPHIAAQVEAFQVAIEAQRYATPAALRALVIERLTATAIDPEVKPAQQLQALALLGKVTEVAAFTERREIIRTDNPTEARDKLVQSLRLALSTGGDGADSLLAELSRRKAGHDAEIIEHVASDPELEHGEHVSHGADADAQGIDTGAEAGETDAGATPPGGTPPKSASPTPEPLLSNPHTSSPNFSAVTNNQPPPKSQCNRCYTDISL
jgi:hypothetical protein